MPFSSLDPAKGLDAFAASLIGTKAREIAQQLGPSHGAAEDFEQILAADLARRSVRYDPARGARTTFAKRVIQNCVATILRHERAAQRNPGRASQSLFAPVGSGSEELQALLPSSVRSNRTGQGALTPQAHCELSWDVAELLDRLPPNLQDVCRLLPELPLRTAAQRLGISRGTLYKRLDEIRRHFQRHDLHVDL